VREWRALQLLNAMGVSAQRLPTVNGATQDNCFVARVVELG